MSKPPAYDTNHRVALACVYCGFPDPTHHPDCREAPGTGGTKLTVCPDCGITWDTDKYLGHYCTAKKHEPGIVTEEPIEVFAPQTWVIIGDKVPATIGKVCVGPDRSITYEVIWWEWTTRKEAWLWHYEIKLADKTRFLPIGFNP